MTARTPAADGFTVPPEWDPHERSLVAWPARASMWGAQLTAAKVAHTEVVRAIAQFEPVLLVANIGDGVEAAAACAGTAFPVDVVEEPINDSWLRDIGPIVVRDRSGHRAGVDFVFNAWGDKFTPYDADAALAAWLCDRLGLAHYQSPIVLEGGSFTVDGAGTLVTTEQCLLHPNRNPTLDRDEIEHALRDWLGIERVVWLAAGLVEDDDTDGHVDNVCAFIGPGVALVQGTADPANPNAPILDANRTRLDAAGIETISIDVLPYDDVAGERVVIPPLNFFFVNGAAIVPVADGDTSAAEAAISRLVEVLPGREVVAVNASVLAFGGGGVHCITQQVPA